MIMERGKCCGESRKERKSGEREEIGHEDGKGNGPVWRGEEDICRE
jgi:hypothetical protein